MADTSALFPPDRLDKAAAAAAAQGVDALLLTPGADLRYLTGYDALPLERLTCLVLPATGPATLVVPRLEHPAAVASPAGRLGIDIVGWGETDDPYALVARLVHDALGVHPASVSLGNRMWAEQVLRFRAVMPLATQGLAGEVLRGLRMRKSAAEVEALREAAEAIDRVHARMGEWLRPGRTEREVGRDIADAIVAEGHKTVNFVIVGSGPNGASPHHDTGDRVIEAGDPVVVDIGGALESGYCSDNTRMYAVGEPPAEFLAYYEVLLAAQVAACDAVKPGVTPESVDAAARDLIAAAGYGDYFVHRTGHGIGLEEHEEPYIVVGNTEPLAAGDCFSIEPGIYLPGKHGARIEDIVVATETGVERLNTISRELVVLPA
ncbi:Xaa-Pro peptidase family protein [Acidothermaceae bacterium B102]|nr:Xaa-Pro peptidase family protein [Acidothermaceae bacterium B102]